LAKNDISGNQLYKFQDIFFGKVFHVRFIKNGYGFNIKAHQEILLRHGPVSSPLLIRLTTFANFPSENDVA